MSNRPRHRNWTACRTALTTALLLASAALVSTSANAAYRELDGIVAVVDDDVVLASELFSRLGTVKKQMEAANVAPPPNDVLVSQLMERLILESIQLQQAERRGVEIDDETLTTAVMSFASQNSMNLDQFQQALAADGMSYREFREEVRREMVISRLQRNLVNRRISISEQDIDNLLNSPYYQQLLSDEFRVGHIRLDVSSNAEDGAAAQAAAEAAEIVSELRTGADFAQMAIARSAAATALEGGDLGWRRAGELPSLFAETIIAMKAGEVAEPIATPGGIHIVKLLEQRGAGVQRVDQTQVRHILVQPSEIRTAAETRALAERIHGRIVAGADFAAMAREFSEDPGSALNGGELGWSTPRDFVPAFAETMEKTAVDEVSQPFESRFGWHVLQVMDRREEDMSERARRNMAVEILHKRRFEEEREEWLKEIRDEAFVEVRL